jgi:hypothetical protein
MFIPASNSSRPARRRNQYLQILGGPPRYDHTCLEGELGVRRHHMIQLEESFDMEGPPPTSTAHGDAFLLRCGQAAAALSDQGEVFRLQAEAAREEWRRRAGHLWTRPLVRVFEYTVSPNGHTTLINRD